MTAAPAIPAVRLILTAFLPFAFGYFLSYVYRAVNAVIAEDLTTDLGVEAGLLGVLTAAYFITFAAFQLPLGVLLDRYGPRRVEASLLVIAAAGALMFSFGDSVTELTLARGLIGLGVSACLMAAFKANVMWWSPSRLPLANGLILASGGVGALAASTPIAALLTVTDWRGIFQILSGLTVLAAVLILTTVPEKPGTPSAPTLAGQLRSVGAIFASRAFWQIAPITVSVQAVFLAYQTLWAAEWMRAVDGLGQGAVAEHLQAMAIGMITGYAAIGLATERLAQRGVPPSRVIAVIGGLFLINQAWILIPGAAWPIVQWPLFVFLATASILGYSILSQAFPPEMAGRVNTAVNLLAFVAAFTIQAAVGWVVDAAVARGSTSADGHRLAFSALFVFCLIGYGWFLAAERSSRRRLVVPAPADD